MDRRKSLKLLAGGAIATGAVVAGCNTNDQKPDGAAKDPLADLKIDRYDAERAREKQLLAMDRFFTEHELATITVLGDIIIPKDDFGGSASEAGVPAFIEFIVKDMPQHQTPLRGGLRWLDLQCLQRYEKTFRECSSQQQIEMVDRIAYPAKAAPELAQGVAFFNLMRNLTATGYYTSPIGIKDLGFVGNSFNRWNGVPADVLQQYNLAYTEKELRECVNFDEVES